MYVRFLIVDWTKSSAPVGAVRDLWWEWTKTIVIMPVGHDGRRVVCLVSCSDEPIGEPSN